MIAVDANVLVYAHRTDSPFHSAAFRKLTSLAESGSPWAIPWPCLHEFLAITTHPRIYRPPTPMPDALTQIDYWMASPALEVIGERRDYWERLKASIVGGATVGPMVHDARIVAICLSHGVDTLWSVDRDFTRFAGIRVVNPLLP